jgi:hypothetical protein
MSWTVACFCGNVYTAPPDRCGVCGRSTDRTDGEARAMSQERITPTGARSSINNPGSEVDRMTVEDNKAVVGRWVHVVLGQ